MRVDVVGDGERSVHGRQDRAVLERDAGARADEDGDGLNNLLEFAFGLALTVPDPAVSWPVVGLSGTSITLTYPRNLSASGITWLVQESTDLATWLPASVTETILFTAGNIETLRDNVPLGAGGRKFLRLQVSIP